ncbi:MAG: hypothetical protein A3J27_12140 [Candidatus Tectomicrobia bacterium RIFCSPLOWO2_12_FULL_69_37]|nr:MAG: hypothetical protein A3I72_12025 [Candidatus Tectomicrobia bacterium RIFCSPLOWO2_02_FULL_70_19]OGL68819.1 MAG: hypothetical protein A3J27_12140 [Candidatus Tectomicrobia bacterium RIFCSPLOWO2_12_FULL_69_37]
MKKIDRIILSLIALALAVIAMNPWVAPGYVTAQGRTMDVNIVEVSGVPITNYYLDSKVTKLQGIPVVVLTK